MKTFTKSGSNDHASRKLYRENGVRFKATRKARTAYMTITSRNESFVAALQEKHEETGRPVGSILREYLERMWKKNKDL